jgi:hypothetical protein
MSAFADGQACALFENWPAAAEWFVVGGTADANEAQTVKARFPDVRCFGVEPNLELYMKQRESGFPGELVRCALWSLETDLRLEIPYWGDDLAPRSGSVCRPYPSPDIGQHVIGQSYRVVGRALDSLSCEYGPFTNVVLWLDIEYAELEALKGARDLMGQVLLINLETFAQLQPAIDDYLRPHGLEFLRKWNERPDNPRSGYDAIYARK